MSCRLLLVDGQGAISVLPLRIRTLREFPGEGGLSVHFRPVRNDRLFDSAKAGGALAYRILCGEGIVRGQLWAEFEVAGEHQNVTGRSADLLFALALVTATWKHSAAQPCIAATGTLDADGTVQAVDRTVEKVAAAVRDAKTPEPLIVFYPAAEASAVAAWQAANPLSANVELLPVAHLDDALVHLGYALDKVYLRNPFRGLEHFDFEHHAIYFGRDREIRDVLRQLLRREAGGAPGLLIEGPSGSGKSSFLRAGVLPALVHLRSQPDEVRETIAGRPFSAGSGRAIWRPGLLASAVDESAIVQSICECWRALPDWPPDWDRGVRTLADLARTFREHWPAARRFTWMIDQFEEIFSIGAPAELVDTLGAFLAELQAAGAWVLAALRADAAAQFKECDSLRAVFGTNEGQYYLAPLRGAALDDVIALPARASSLAFEVGADGRSLEQALREEAYQEPDSLPRLQFTLNELYLRRSGNLLTFTAYREVGGLAGSVAQAAEAVLESVDAGSQRAVPRMFRSLVSVNEAGHATRRYASRAEISQDPAQQRLTQRMVDARLCVTDERNGEAVVAFAHDSLLRTLPALTEWLRQEAGLLQTRELVQRETRLWQQHGEADSWLATADKLVSFRSLETAEVPLPPPVPEFLRRSKRRVRRAKRVRQAAIGAIAVLAVVASSAAWVAVRKQREAEYQTAQTLAAQSRSLTEAAAGRLKDNDVGGAQDIILDVLARRPADTEDSAWALDIFQHARALDAQVLAIYLPARLGRAAFSPDGTRIVMGGYDGTARIWDLATGRQVQVFRGHTAPVFKAVFSPDGKRVVTTAQDNTARIWDVATGRQEVLLAGHRNRAAWVACSPDGRQVLTASREGIWIWDAQTGRHLFTLEPGALVSTAMYSPDGKRIASADGDGNARIWDLATRRQIQIMKGHIGPARGVAFSPDGKQIVTAGDDSTARVWDVATGRQVYILTGHSERLMTADFSPDGKSILTSSSDRTLRIWDAATTRELRRYRGHTDWIYSAFSPDGRRIVSSSADRSLRVWDFDPAAATLIGTPRDALGVINNPDFSPDGKRIATSTNDDKGIAVFDVASAREILKITGHEAALNQVQFSPDGTRILSSADDKTARVWDAATGTQLLKLEGHTERVPGVRFSADGTRIITTADDRTARIWDAGTGKTLQILTGHTAAVNDGAFCADGQRAVTVSVDKTARIWDVDTGRLVRELKGHTASISVVGVSHHGRRIITGSRDNTARVWDADTGEQLLVLRGNTTRVNSVGFSRDDTRILTSGDHTVRVFDAATGQLQLLREYTEQTHGAQLSPDGRWGATIIGDEYLRIWDARAEPLDVQIAWSAAAQIDPLAREQRFQLGLVDSPDPPAAHAGKCTAAALPPVEAQDLPIDRPDPMVPFASAAACASEANEQARLAWRHGQEMVEAREFAQARTDFEAAIAGGYGPARLDLALLLSRPAAKITDLPRARTLLESAWKDGLALAGFELGELAAANDSDEAWAWYRRAADAGEPHALARFGERATDAAYAAAAGPPRRERMLESFRYYAAAAEVAQREEWPDASWRDWRYHRASLARLLAREGMMREVAEAFGRVRGR